MKTIEKFHSIQELLVRNNKYGLTRKEISECLELPKSTCYRFLNELKQYGYIRRNNNTGRYYLGYQHLRYADCIMERIEEARVCLPHLERYHQRSDETTFYAKLNERICTDVVLCGFTDTKVSIARGHELPLHASAAGKTILAFLDEVSRYRLLKQAGLPALTEHTITDMEPLLSQLDEVRNTGKGYSLEEMNEGINALATPVFSRGKGVVGAISLVGRSDRLQPEILRSYSYDFLESSRTITEELGGIFPCYL